MERMMRRPVLRINRYLNNMMVTPSPKRLLPLIFYYKIALWRSANFGGYAGTWKTQPSMAAPLPKSSRLSFIPATVSRGRSTTKSGWSMAEALATG